MTTSTPKKPRAAKRRRPKKETTTQTYPVVIDKESFDRDNAALDLNDSITFNLVLLPFLYLEHLTKLVLKRFRAIA